MCRRMPLAAQDKMILDISDESIKTAAKRLKSGGLVAMPTETVYGLAADATNDRAVAAIFEAKGRPVFNPVIVHYADGGDAEADVVFNSRAELLATVFWPGPLTMILPRRENASLSLLTSAGLPTQAVRLPAHPVARKLIRALGHPIAAPSANSSGSLSPTTPQHVIDSLGGKIDMVLAGGKSVIGLESTVVDMTGDIPVLLRPGAVTLEDLQMHLGEVLVETEAVDGKPKSPGQLLKHYAPETPLRLRAVDVKAGEALLAFSSTRFMNLKDAAEVLNLSETGDLNEAAANLFAMLHQLDAARARGIAVMDIPDLGLGAAINDRLRRAAGAQSA